MASDYVLLTDGDEPKSFDKTMSHKRKNEWLDAMHEEMNFLYKNATFELVELLKGKKHSRTSGCSD
jgi:hypothetical protein